MSDHEQHRGLQPLEGLCCAARCERLSEHEVEVRMGGRTSRVRMCPEHAAHHPTARPVRVLTRDASPGRALGQALSTSRSSAGC